MNSKTALKKLRELVDEAAYSAIVSQLAGTTILPMAAAIPFARVFQEFFIGKRGNAERGHPYGRNRES